MYFSVRTCLIFVVYLDNHFQAQELSNDLPGFTKQKKPSTVEPYILWTLGQVLTPEKVGPLALHSFSVPITWPTALVPRHLKNNECFSYTNCQVLNLLGICYRRRGISNALDYDFSIMSRGDKKFVK